MISQVSEIAEVFSPKEALFDKLQDFIEKIGNLLS